MNSMSEQREAASIEKVTDYGLGTYGHDKPLVLASFRTDVYHRHDHGGRVRWLDTWTEDFVRNVWNMRPCRTCWPQAHSGRTDDA